MSDIKKFSHGVLQMGTTKLYSPTYRENISVGVRRAYCDALEQPDEETREAIRSGYGRKAVKAKV